MAHRYGPQSAMSEPLAFFRGEMVPASQARLAIYDAGIVMGATVTDMVRTFRQKLFRLDDHLDRFFDSLAAVGFDIGLSRTELHDQLVRLVDHNAGLIEANKDLSLCMFATAGELTRYAGGASACPSPTMCAHTFPLAFELWAAAIQTGAQVVTPDIRQIPAATLDPAIKHRSRLHYYLAGKQAEEIAAGSLPLLLDQDGYVTETVGANILVVIDGTIVSPSAEKTLKGVSLKVVGELASQLAIPMEFRDLTVDAVAAADEVFLASTPYCLLPVTQINGSVIGNGRPGPILGTLIGAWNELVGIDIHQQIIEA
jgi:branched-chain amino acid aminotransferase